MVGQANKSAQELMDFPHVNQHSGPPVSLLSSEAKEKTVRGGESDGTEGGPWDILYSEEILIGGREIEEG